MLGVDVQTAEWIDLCTLKVAEVQFLCQHSTRGDSDLGKESTTLNLYAPTVAGANQFSRLTTRGSDDFSMRGSKVSVRMYTASVLVLKFDSNPNWSRTLSCTMQPALFTCSADETLLLRLMARSHNTVEVENLAVDLFNGFPT